MKIRQKRTDDLYYRSILINTPAAIKYKRELKNIDLSTHEAKKFLICFEEWAKYVIFTNNLENNNILRETFLSYIFQKNQFDYLQYKFNDDNHPMLRVFNLFVRARNGDFSKLEDLIDEVDYCPISDTYDFRWM